MELRIGGGEFRGRLLHHGQGQSVRPTPGAVRAALADILRDRLPGARVLDLFAGFGSTGLELLSRGAGEVVFVEKDNRAAAILRRNLELLAVLDRTHLWQMPVAAALDRTDLGRYDIVFVDPPYERGLACGTTVRLGDRGGMLAPEAVVIVQHSRREELPAEAGGLRRWRERRSGDTVLSFYEEANSA